MSDRDATRNVVVQAPLPVRAGSGYWRAKVAVVTGGSSGFGLVLAETFAAAGARVVIAARGSESLSRVAAELQGRGLAVQPAPTDITQQAQVDALFRQTLDEFGRLDVLVNNAGRSSRGRVLDTTAEEFDELMSLNFIAAVRCTRAAVPQLLKTRGHVVNMGSLAAKAASRYVGAYPATKFALAAYSQQLRLELGEEGLHVLLVCPGPIARDDAGVRYQSQMEGLPAKAAGAGAGVRVSSIQPAKLAQAILKACERRQPELVMPRRARLLFAISQLWPKLGDWLVRKAT